MRSTAERFERAEPLPGDEVVADPDWTTNFAIDVAARPEAVWPWLLQMGYGRAGWYTWFPLDNGGVPSADTVVPALQDVKVGDVFPDGPRAAEGFGVWRVRRLDPNRALVLHSRREPVTGREIPTDGQAAKDIRTDPGFIDCTWAFVLVPTPSGTRVRVRVRAGLRGRLAKPGLAKLARLLFGVGDNVMENSLLVGLRARAEGVGAH
ncbi:MAG TPA: hypothetical protein VGF45_24110 [Polyangia bacterium]